MDYQYDIAVIGAGPGRVETPSKRLQMGKKTCIIESTYLGGTCLNVGCIPTKTLIKTANVLDTVKHAADFAVEGVDLSALKVDMAKLQKRRQKVVSTLVGGVRGLLRGNKVDILEGTASFADTHTLTVGDKQVSAEYIIVATGLQRIHAPLYRRGGGEADCSPARRRWSWMKYPTPLPSSAEGLSEWSLPSC